MNCKTCGASFDNTGNKTSYKCEYCGSYNYDEKFIEKRFENLNISKANEVLNVAQLRYKSGRFEEAIELITESLKENNECVEAWGILASCRIYTLNTGNFDKNIISIEECMRKIKKLDEDSSKEFFIEIHEKLLEKTLKLSTQHISKSVSVYDAYATTDVIKAKNSAIKYNLIAINMINTAHKINQEFTEPSVKASIYVLFAIFNNKELANEESFTSHKENAQKVLSNAYDKSEESTNQLIQSLGLEVKNVKKYLKNKTPIKKQKKKGGFFKKFLITIIVIFIILVVIANS